MAPSTMAANSITDEDRSGKLLLVETAGSNSAQRHPVPSLLESLAHLTIDVHDPLWTRHQEPISSTSHATTISSTTTTIPREITIAAATLPGRDRTGRRDYLSASSSARHRLRRTLQLRPSRLQRSRSAPQTIQSWKESEANLESRRSQCESHLRQLFEERKSQVEELFQTQWLISDAIVDNDDDEEEDDDDDEEDKEEDLSVHSYGNFWNDVSSQYSYSYPEAHESSRDDNDGDDDYDSWDEDDLSQEAEHESVQEGGVLEEVARNDQTALSQLLVVESGTTAV